MSRNIVLDTNCLVQIISAHSPYTRMFDPHFRILETIPFPSVNVRRLEEFLLDLQG